MHAVIGTWGMDPQLAAQQRAMLLEVVVPSVRSAPGLVKGYWAGGLGNRSHSFIVFETEDAPKHLQHRCVPMRRLRARAGSEPPNSSSFPLPLRRDRVRRFLSAAAAGLGGLGFAHAQ